MENQNEPVQPLQPVGEAPQPSVLDRVLHRGESAEAQEPAPVVDNVRTSEVSTCQNPSCDNFGQALGEDNVCSTCGYNGKERF